MSTPTRTSENWNQRLMSRLALPPIPRRLGLEGLEALEIAAPLAPPEPVMKVDERVAAAESVLYKRAEAAPGVDRVMVGKLVREGESGLRKLNSEGVRARLTQTEMLGLEAVVETDGSRPVLMVQDGSIDLKAPDLNTELGLPWQYAARERLVGIRRVVASVGVVQLPDFDNMRIGTGFTVAPGLILTNRHVLEAIARFDDGKWSWKYKAQIDFGAEFERPVTHCFDVDAVLMAGPNPIDGRVNFANLDIALIHLRPGPHDFPPGLPLGETADTVKVGPAHTPSVYVVGFPAKPSILTGVDIGAEPPAAGTEFEDVVTHLFKDEFGVKRWAPGFVQAGAGQLFDDARKWVMSHDASTLGGNSGSCIIDFSGNNALVVGLHFGGRSRVENWAHVLAAIRTELAAFDLHWSDKY
ncbi:MAG TPA: serine protease [Telluria sp.]